MLTLFHVNKTNFNRFKMDKKINTFAFQDYLEPIYDIDIDTNDYEYHSIACYNRQAIYATETLFISNTISLSDILKRDNQQRADFFKFDMIATFFQIYSFLYIYQDIFTHNDLKNEDILLFYIPDNIFNFSYEFNGKKIQFETHYLVKITNLRMCYLHGITDKIWKKMDKTILPVLNKSRDISFLFNFKKMSLS